MAISNSHSKDQLKPLVKTSDTGHAESPAKKAPLKAKHSVLLGGEQTSDGYRAEREQEERHADKRNGARGDAVKINERKLQDASLEPHLDKPSIDKHH